jgi:hypothetical protein
MSGSSDGGRERIMSGSSDGGRERLMSGGSVRSPGTRSFSGDGTEASTAPRPASVYSDASSDDSRASKSAKKSGVCTCPGSVGWGLDGLRSSAVVGGPVGGGGEGAVEAGVRCPGCPLPPSVRTGTGRCRGMSSCAGIARRCWCGHSGGAAPVCLTVGSVSRARTLGRKRLRFARCDPVERPPPTPARAAKRRLDKDIPALARRQLKKQMHHMRKVLPDFDVRRAIQLKNAATRLGLWSFTGDTRCGVCLAALPRAGNGEWESGGVCAACVQNVCAIYNRVWVRVSPFPPSFCCRVRVGTLKRSKTGEGRRFWHTRPRFARPRRKPWGPSTGVECA